MTGHRICTFVLGLSISALACACSQEGPSAARRVTLQEVGGATVKLVPTADQLPFCLVFSVSDKGVVRQLTMTSTNHSVACPAGSPVGGVAYRIPASEGRVRVHVLFSDRKLDAAPIGAQVHELAGKNPRFSAMDLRAPGKVLIETLEYTPSLESEGITVVGSQVGDAPSAAPPSAAPSASAP